MDREKGSNYLEQSIQEMKELLSGVETIEEAASLMSELLTEKIRQSFKNGIEVGRRKPAGRKGQAGKRWFRKK